MRDVKGQPKILKLIIICIMLILLILTLNNGLCRKSGVSKSNASWAKI